MCKRTCSIQSRVWKKENKSNWNGFGRNLVCSYLINILQLCAENEWSRHWIFFSFFRESVYCGFMLLVWTEEWLKTRRGSSIESAANACEFMLGVERGLSHERKVNWGLLVLAVAPEGWHTFVTRKIMNLPKQKILYYFGFLSTVSLARCWCVYVVAFLCTFLWCSGNSYIPQHRAK